MQQASQSVTGCGKERSTAFGWIAAGWEYVGIFQRALLVSRVGVVMVVAGWLLLCSDQGRDVLLALAGEVGSGTPHGFWVLAATLILLMFWMVSTWYWTLTLLRFDFPSFWQPDALPKPYRTWATFLVRWLPVALGLLCFAGFWFNLAPEMRGISQSTRTGYVWLEYGTYFVVILFILYEVIHRRLLQLPSEPTRRQGIKDFWRSSQASRKRKGMIAACLLALSVILGVTMLSVAWAEPVWLGNHIRTETLFFIWAATFIPILSIAVYLTAHYRVPILTILLLLAIGFSSCNDNHEVRELPKNAANPTERLTVAEAAADWWRTINQSAESGQATAAPVKRQPLIIVATAGGGSRAAYWTATVLGRLQDCYPQFARHTFAISGVSGGSLGAAAFRAVLTDLPPNPPAPCTANNAARLPGGVAEKSQEVVGRDFLTATVAATLYPDLVQRFLWWPIKSADRGRAIERAWEDSYRRAMAIPPEADGGRFAGSFINVAVAKSGSPDAMTKQWPALFLNATWVETGRRLVISPYRLRQQQTSDANDAFPIAHDLLALLGRDVPLSTAASLSARFPYVLPAATIIDELGKVQGRAVDGGYFENYGANTASEILAEVRAALGPSQFAILQPIVIQLSSDPSLPDDFGALCNAEHGKCEVEPIQFGPEFRSPIRTFMKTRQSRGVLALANLKAAVEGLGGQFIHFRLCPANDLQSPETREVSRTSVDSELAADTEGKDLPLGWALSDRAKDLIRGMLPPFDQPDVCRQINDTSWKTMHTILLSSGST